MKEAVIILAAAIGPDGCADVVQWLDAVKGDGKELMLVTENNDEFKTPWEWWVNPQTGEYTILAVTSQERRCPIANGLNWQPVK